MPARSDTTPAEFSGHAGISGPETPSTSGALNVTDAVRARYARGATEQVPELCCPVDYDASLLAVLPPEIVDRDYGCGDPSRFVQSGDVVLDLGSGAGKIAYMASQLVGAEGRVVGVDTTPEMLELSRHWRGEIGDRIGWHNVEFRNAWIQDLQLDRDALAQWLERHPVRDAAGRRRIGRPRPLELRAQPGR